MVLVRGIVVDDGVGGGLEASGPPRATNVLCQLGINIEVGRV